MTSGTLQARAGDAACTASPGLEVVPLVAGRVCLTLGHFPGEGFRQPADYRAKTHADKCLQGAVSFPAVVEVAGPGNESLPDLHVKAASGSSKSQVAATAVMPMEMAKAMSKDEFTPRHFSDT